ncbi:TorF family putative porin [Halochromatium salexigens]|uniref:Porin n=1 Tax=Halochromatium salexigens TaxID=49447 RepID=A0AAJ0UHJ5_HALSE|nr:TorF family putative porin [Halochromatium salexigens]MBK5931608.1 hypothetical protein [Halochromatium salexigens]
MKIQRVGIAAAASGALLSVSMLTAAPALAQGPWALDANIGAVSNYIWRGVSQTGDEAAVQGGLDLSHESGFYAGTWASNVDFGADEANYELDVYAGYDFILPNDDFSLGLNTIYYAYPDGDSDIDFWEIGISGGYKWVSLGIQYTAWGDDDNEDTLFDEGDLYYSIGVDVPLAEGFSIGAFAGYYDFDNDVSDDVNADYSHWGATISKEAGDFGTFNFTYEQNDGGDDDVWDDDAKVWVGWNKAF